MSRPAPTADEIAASTRLFLSPGQITELRALNVGGENRTFAGFFEYDRLRDLGRHALALSREASGVYFIPNPIDSRLLERKPNTVSNVPGKKSPGRFELTTDRDILERRFLIVDIDPTRTRPTTEDDPAAIKIDAKTFVAPLEPFEQKQMTRSAETRIAQFVAEDVSSFLQRRGWKAPVVMMSGNGIHLVFRLSSAIPHYPAELDPLAEVLRTLHKQYEVFRGLITIDKNTYNAARMLKVPGTMVRKGTDSPNRPWRRTEIIEVPNEWNAESGLGPAIASGACGVPL